MLVDFRGDIVTAKGAIIVENGEKMTVALVVNKMLVEQMVGSDVSQVEKGLRWELMLRINSAPGPIEVSETELEVVNRLLDRSSLAILYTQQIKLALQGKPNPLQHDPMNIVPIRPTAAE